MTTTGPGTTSAPVEAPRELDEPASMLEPLYHLVLLDDDHHTYAYVIEMLGKIFGYGREKSFALARIVDSAGRVVVETAEHERVTRGSMSAIVEPADGP
jgi:ATP-dependent Clp protease adaptor protein ClpS